MSTNMHLSDGVRVTRVVNATAAGTTDVNGTGVDMTADGGYDGVLFVAMFGALTATQVTKLKAQSSSDDGSSDSYADIAGSATDALADGDGNDCLMLDVIRPPERYIRPVVDRGTANAVIDGVIAIQYRGRDLPTTNGATIIDLVKLVNPAEGTA
jgi:hypothetical protein